MKNTKSCPFCRIVAAQDPDVREVCRTPGVVAFFPTDPAVLGHTLIIPHVHRQDIWSLTRDEGRALSDMILLIAHAIRHAISPHGLNVIQSNGEAATQSVPHVHYHVVPRWDNDKVGRIWPRDTDYSEPQKDAAWDAIRAAATDLALVGANGDANRNDG